MVMNMYYTDFVLITARKRSLGQGNVFTPACHSVQGKVCIRRVLHAGGSTFRGGLHPGGLHPEGVCIRGEGLGRPSHHTTGYGQLECILVL